MFLSLSLAVLLPLLSACCSFLFFLKRRGETFFFGLVRGSLQLDQNSQRKQRYLAYSLFLNLENGQLKKFSLCLRAARHPLRSLLLLLLLLHRHLFPLHLLLLMLFPLLGLPQSPPNFLMLQKCFVFWHLLKAWISLPFGDLSAKICLTFWTLAIFHVFHSFRGPASPQLSMIQTLPSKISLDKLLPVLLFLFLSVACSFLAGDNDQLIPSLWSEAAAKRRQPHLSLFLLEFSIFSLGFGCRFFEFFAVCHCSFPIISSRDC